MESSFRFLGRLFHSTRSALWRKQTGVLCATSRSLTSPATKPEGAKMRKDADGDVKRNRLDYRRGARRASNHEWTPIAVPSRKVNPGLRIETGGTQGFVVPDRGWQENSKAYLAPGDLGAGCRSRRDGRRLRRRSGHARLQVIGIDDGLADVGVVGVVKHHRSLLLILGARRSPG